MFSCEFCKISKNTFSYRTPPVAASVLHSVPNNLLFKIRTFSGWQVWIFSINSETQKLSAINKYLGLVDYILINSTETKPNYNTLQNTLRKIKKSSKAKEKRKQGSLDSRLCLYMQFWNFGNVFSFPKILTRVEVVRQLARQLVMRNNYAYW